MKNIIFDCERMKYADTGLYHYCLNLGRHLEKKLEHSEHLTYFAPSSARPALNEHAGHISQNSLQKFFMPSTRGYHIWHSTYQSSSYIPQRNRRIKVVLSIHDLNFLYEGKSEARRDKHLRHLQQNINRADVIVCISEFCRKDLLTYCDTGNKPVYVIHNGTNTLKMPGLSRNSYKPERPFLFSLGVICRKKNFHVLLPLLEQNRDMELVIAGRPDDPEYMQFIHQSARRLKVDNNLRLLGNISEYEKSWYYRNCYAFALPSIAEGFGLPVAEAMSVGKPVFLSDRTALPEIGSDLAFYFRDFTAQHMQKVFTSGMQQYRDENMHNAIRQHSESFCWDKAAAEYLNIYRTLY